MGQKMGRGFKIKDDGTIVRDESNLEMSVMSRYELEFVVVPLVIDSYNENLRNGTVSDKIESKLCDISFWKDVSHSVRQFDKTDFDWNEISFSQFQAGKMKFIVIEFPEPQRVAQAKYGLIAFDGEAKYYTLEKTMVFSQNNSPKPGWIIGGKSNTTHTNYGYFQGELSPKSFVLEILQKFYNFEIISDKSDKKSPDKSEKEGCWSSFLGFIGIVLITTVIGGVIGFFVDEHDSLEMGILFGCLFGIASVICSFIGELFNK